MRSSRRILEWGAALLAGIGLFVVWGVARQATVPTVLAGDIAHTANWAFVQMRGVVTRYPVYDEESGYLGFWIDDSSGEILVTAYRGVSRKLVSEGAVPAIGDVAAVRGTLRVKQDSTVLLLNASEHLVVERPEAVDVPIAQIDGHVHQKVRVLGQVREVRMPYEGLTVLNVRDETGSVDVVYDLDLVSLSGAPLQVLPGDSVSVRGAVTRYKGRPQISLDAASGLQRVSRDIAIAAQRSAGEISPEDKERWVRIRGIVTDVHVLSAGSKCVLNDGTGAIAVILWTNLLDVLSAQVKVGQGAWLDVQGVVTEYRGELEVIPELACDVRALRPPHLADMVRPLETPAARTAFVPLLSGRETPTVRPEVVLSAPSRTAIPLPSETPTLGPVTPTLRPVTSTTVPRTATASVADTLHPSVPGPSETSTGLLSASYVGQRVAIRGRIVEATQFAPGVRSYVDDGSGPVVVWMVQKVYEKLPNGAGWRVGSLVRVSGRVDQFKGEIEIVPQDVVDVVLEKAAALLAEPTVPISELSAARVGERVTVEAGIVAVEPFSEGVKALLDDGSAQITLLLWQNVYDVVPDREQLIAGAVVCVAGEVQEYRGELEIVPGMGADVVLAARE